MARLTYREPQTGKIYFYTPDSEVLEKLAKYEDLEDKCLKEYGFDLYMIAQKYNEFLEHMHELAEFWELEEKGLLLKLPCKVGDVVYDIDNYKVGREWVDEGYDHLGRRGYYHNVYRQRVRGIPFKIEYLNKIGTSVFLTKEEAEVALKKLKGE